MSCNVWVSIVHMAEAPVRGGVECGRANHREASASMDPVASSEYTYSAERRRGARHCAKNNSVSLCAIQLCIEDLRRGAYSEGSIRSASNKHRAVPGGILQVHPMSF